MKTYDAYAYPPTATHSGHKILHLRCRTITSVKCNWITFSEMRKCGRIKFKMLWSS